jgi:hypothetical protein
MEEMGRVASKHAVNCRFSTVFLWNCDFKFFDSEANGANTASDGMISDPVRRLRQHEHPLEVE